MTNGTVERTADHVTFSREHRFDRPIEAVWHAITVPAEVQRWMGTRPEIERRQGGQYVIHHQGDHRVVDRVLRVEPPRLFEHTYFEHLNPGAVVTWALGPAHAGGCSLTLTHVLTTDDVRGALSGVAAGDDEITVLSRNAAGWHQLLDLLRTHLGEDVPARSLDERLALQRRYAELLR